MAPLLSIVKHACIDRPVAFLHWHSLISCPGRLSRQYRIMHAHASGLLVYYPPGLSLCICLCTECQDDCPSLTLPAYIGCQMYPAYIGRSFCQEFLKRNLVNLEYLILLLLIGGVKPPRILGGHSKKIEKSYKFSKKSETSSH